MKKSVVIGLFLMLSIFSFAGVLAEGCDLDISLINQDPYPAIPGDYVKLVFQIDGVNNIECKTVDFELLEQYPLIFDPDEQPRYTINAGLYDKDYSSYLLAPYKVRIDGDALDGDNPIEVQYRFGGNVGFETQQFDLNVEDTRADFEIYVKDYSALTGIITLEILNVAESDIEALTLEIINQENIQIKGSKTNIVGDLDSNDYTTADFEAVPSAGEFKVKISYTDSIGERRVLEKNILYESEYFEDRVGDQKKTSIWTYIFWIAVVLVVVYYFWRRHKKKKALKQKLGRK